MNTEVRLSAYRGGFPAQGDGVVFSLWHQIYVERVYDPVALGWESPPVG